MKQIYYVIQALIHGRFRHLFITGVSALMILKLLLIHCFFRQWVLRS